MNCDPELASLVNNTVVNLNFVVINDALNYIVRCELDMKDHKYAHLEPVELFHKVVIHHLRLCHPK